MAGKAWKEGRKAVKNRKGSIRYSQSILKLSSKAASEAATDEEIINLIGCANSTYYKWLNDKPEFAKAIADARTPEGQDEDLVRLAKRKEDAQKWLDDYLANQGEVLEVCTSTGVGSYVKRTKGKAPDMKLIDRILGTNTEAQKFDLNISIAEPEPDLDDFEE